MYNAVIPDYSYRTENEKQNNVIGGSSWHNFIKKAKEINK